LQTLSHTERVAKNKRRKIMETKKIKGLRKACSEINQNRGLHYKVMYNVVTREVWVDGFVDCNGWCEYADENVKNVGQIPQGIWDDYRHIYQAEIAEMITN
jgi:hypothetical protein